MDHNKLRKLLGYSSAADMFKTINFTYSRYYKLKPESQQLKLMEIMMKHYDVTLEDIVASLEFQRTISENIPKKA